MAKRNRIVATYRMGADEYVQASVEADNAYPEALAVARANARELVAEMLSDALALNRGVVAEPSAEASEQDQP